MSDKPKKLKIEIPEYDFNISNNIIKTPVFNRHMKYNKSFDFSKDLEENNNLVIFSPLKKIKIK